MVQENNKDFEQALFKTADKLRKNIDAAEYPRSHAPAWECSVLNPHKI